MASRPEQPARFAVGDHVAVVERPGERRHVRTPRYVQGAVGVVTGVHGPHLDPERLAYGLDGHPPVWLYAVQIPLAQLFPDGACRPGDVLAIDLYEHWLRPADEVGTTRTERVPD
ncbi:MAG: nitrile hydratase subunit beta [Nitriliruptorales bacterium]|nr:nitrile hydratase subunit beta [Nitriliruptorales bacterium]